MRIRVQVAAREIRVLEIEAVIFLHVRMGPVDAPGREPGQGILQRARMSLEIEIPLVSPSEVCPVRQLDVSQGLRALRLHVKPHLIGMDGPARLFHVGVSRQVDHVGGLLIIEMVGREFHVGSGSRRDRRQQERALGSRRAVLHPGSPRRVTRAWGLLSRRARRAQPTRRQHSGQDRQFSFLPSPGEPLRWPRDPACAQSGGGHARTASAWA